MNGENSYQTEEKPDIWITEYLTPYDAYNHGVKQLIHVSNTKYQSMIIADTGNYGRALFLDGKIQTTEGDEPFYHEPLVHVPCVMHGEPKSVLILGGADCGAAREALRWSSVQSVTVVDLDGEVVDACRKYLTKIAGGALKDPRTKVLIEDALDFIEHTSNTFDVIICDLTDPMEDSPSLSLFTDTFFQKLRTKLNPNGAIAVQGGPASLRENPSIFPRVYATLKKVFNTVRPYQIFAPTYGSPLSMLAATMADAELPSVERVDALLDELDGELWVLDGQAFHALFGIPRHVKKILQEEQQICTIENTANAFGRGHMSKTEGYIA